MGVVGMLTTAAPAILLNHFRGVSTSAQQPNLNCSCDCNVFLVAPSATPPACVKKQCVGQNRQGVTDVSKDSV